MPNTIDTHPHGFEPDQISRLIANRWQTWGTAKNEWNESRKELRQYLFATDTRKTANAALPWKNSTVTPKLTQIRDNLHANYMAALFPNDNWFQWQGEDEESVTKEKRDRIEAYMRTKLRASGFEETVSQLVLDYIDYGNVFGGHEFVCEKKKDAATGEEVVAYAGPRVFRVSPLDIVFDPTSVSFDKSPCIVRRVKSLGDLAKDQLEKPALGYKTDVLEKVKGVRLAPADVVDRIKSDGLIVDGFGPIEQYFSSGMVELLDFYGDIYDQSTGTFHADMLITVVDRRWVLRMQPNDSWTGSRPIKHVGWRTRPDNLWAQGPLDQLVGIQYRIDHLENLKADVFDQIAHPVVEIKGQTTEDFTFGPGAVFFSGTDGGIAFHRPEAQALTADMQINTLMDRMEEMAGAPKQAMGIRTPGEKTKYEVQVLENGAGRIFQSKVSWFEKNVIEPLLNSMLEEAVRKMGTKDTINLVDPDYGTDNFKDITKGDITAKGKFYAIGARHFAEQAKFVQELTQTLQIVERIPSVKAHISGKAVAKAMEEVMGWKSFHIVQDNALVTEQAETQRLMNTAGEQLHTEAGMPSELQDADYQAPDAEQAA